MTSPKRMKASDEDWREVDTNDLHDEPRHQEGFRDGLSSRQRIEDAIASKEELKRQRTVRLKGHDCNDHVVHGYDPESQLGDYYVCGICDELLQVG